MIDYSALYSRMHDDRFSGWRELLPTKISSGLDEKRDGNLSRWLDTIGQLPIITPSSIDLSSSHIRVGSSDQLNHRQCNGLIEQLKTLHPWRKGPFEIMGIPINTEWHSDWKWDRLKDHIQDLRGRTILDVGSGNGYYGWRMVGAGAALVIGIDPTLYSVMQYQAIQHFVNSTRMFVLPLGIDDVPRQLKVFDTVFSLGVIYHRRSPLEHIKHLNDCLRPGGELVLESLVIDGNEDDVLFPEGRYAKMRNVWSIPSCLLLEKWVKDCGLNNVRIINTTTTTINEQRTTHWMTFQSLGDFLDTDDPAKTIEGYPAPRRAILIAEKPS